LVLSQYPYIVAYREQSGEVHILAVVHTSRRWPSAELTPQAAGNST
jgi:plasmid stabilization system protein ParE